MDKNSFINEMEGYSISDLKLIITDQKELYSKEELQIIEDIYKKKNSIKEEKSNIDYAEALFCIMGVIIPFGGLVSGIIMLITGSAAWKRVGRHTLSSTAISVLIRIFIYNGGFNI